MGSSAGASFTPISPSFTPISCLSSAVAPVIDRSNLDDIRVRAGQMIKFDARVTGEPVPKKTWFINKARQEADKDGIKIDEEDHRTKLVIPSCTRAHNGTFVIKAENTAGKDEVAIEVIVLGKFFLSLQADYCADTGCIIYQLLQHI